MANGDEVHNTPNLERVALWEQALRDPNLIQGHAYLASSDTEEGPWRQCCLDVACRVAIEHGVQLQQVIHQRGTFADGSPASFFVRGYQQPAKADSAPVFSVLPEPVRNWFGFNSRWVPLQHEGNLVDATDLNDTLLLTFPQIADAIYATYLAPEEVDDVYFAPEEVDDDE